MSVTSQPETRAPELGVALDMARRALPVAPVLVLVCGIGWGLDGALSAGLAIVLVLLNFLAAAGLMAWGASVSQGALVGAVLGGYILRFGFLTVAVLAVRDASWVERAPLFGALLLTHIGLLVWETRFVSATLAYPGLRPRPNAQEARTS
jgi:hypothetical protein